jgi:uncharacterized protein (DUF1330 family)
MSAYFVVTYDITDPAGYEPYVPGVIPLLQKHGAEILVADYESQVMEGDKRNVVVVLKFENEDKAKAWYNDPDYEPLKKLRLSVSDNSSAFLTKQFVPPEA